MDRELTTFFRTRKKANLAMVIINVAVFLVLSAFGSTESSAFMAEHGACYTPLIVSGEYWRLMTGMFLHFGLVHLLYNMVCLLALGNILETYMGSVRYLLIYMTGGIAGNLLSMAIELRSGIFAVSAGASGAIFAVIGAVLALVIRRGGRLGSISLERMGLMAILMIAQGFMETGTNNVAHVGGFITGLLLGLLLDRRNR